MNKISNDVIEYVKKGNIEYIQFKKLLKFPEIKHCYTLKSNNMISFDSIYVNEEKLKKSYENISKALGISPDSIVKPHQTHTDNVVVVNKNNFDDEEYLSNVDGIISNETGLTLLTTSADCTSLIFYDYMKHIIGSVHSGWRGTLKGIAKKTILKMEQEFGSKPQDIICGICPCIRKCCFEVEADVRNLFFDKYSYLKNIEDIIVNGRSINNIQKFYIDTVEINKQLLKEVGLKEENILDSGICTKCNSKYFHSYRTEKENSGRNGALICLV